MKRAARSLLLVGLLLAVLAMFGCASAVFSNAVHMTDNEVKSCRNAANGCSVWTEDELRRLAQAWFKKGYRYGWKHANEEAGRDL